jgi:hypothetical protein
MRELGAKATERRIELLQMIFRIAACRGNEAHARTSLDRQPEHVFVEQRWALYHQEAASAECSDAPW